MLKQLDTLIGFAVVMSVVSLLITIVTQTISALLGLRGKNLADALEAMICMIAPTITSGSAKELAMKVLTHPVISDSVLSMTPNWLDKVPIVSWFLQKARVASAIRPDELYYMVNLLKQTGGGKVAVPPGLPADQAAELTAKLLADKTRISASADSFLTALEALPSNDTTLAAIAAMKAQLPALAAKDLAQAKAVIQHSADVTNAAFVNLEKWFNSAQDRAKQWFLVHTRVITLVSSFFAAFILQLDTITLFKQISTDSDLRDKLVASTPAVQNLASSALSADNQGDITKLETSINQINKVSEASGLQLLPSPYPFDIGWIMPLHHLLGIIISASLLGLGAPFWFNTLKSLTNLRPLLATNVDNSPNQTSSVSPAS